MNENTKFELHLGDCLKVLPTLPEDSVDCVITDPPYGLTSDGKKGFMNQEWDKGVPGVHFWKEILRVAKPGAYLLSFGGCRTFHRLTCAIEDAGWEIKDCLMFVFGVGFPKSLNMGKAFEEKGLLDMAKKYAGVGTSLKPCYEPIILARKPLTGTFVDNILAYGTGGLNIDACRIPTEENIENHSRSSEAAISKGKYGDSKEQETYQTEGQKDGRFPGNFLHDGSPSVLKLFPDSTTKRIEKPSDCSVGGSTSFDSMRGNRPARGYDGEGSAARFFFCPKASKLDREEGLEHLPAKLFGMSGGAQAAAEKGEEYDNGDGGVNRTTLRRNIHPTVKNTNLCRWLCKLICPKNGIIMDPFMGSGSTGKAAMLESFRFIGVELEPEYMEIAKARIEWAEKQAEEIKLYGPKPKTNWVKVVPENSTEWM